MIIGVNIMMCHIKKDLLLELVQARGHTLNSFSKVVHLDVSTLNKFNGGEKIRKVNAVKIFTLLKQLPLHEGDVTNEFDKLAK